MSQPSASPADTLAVLDAIPAPQIPAAITRLAGRLLASGSDSQPDELLSTHEAATLLKVTRRWLYRHADELGVVRLSRRKVVFPRRVILTRVARKGRRS